MLPAMPQPTPKHLIFDLDGTLYSTENGYEDHTRQRVFDYMHEHLGIPKAEAPAVWRPLFKQHNQTLKGLRSGGFEIDAGPYWDFIREGTQRFLLPDPQVRALLDSLPQPKYVFTNCSELHAELALQSMGLQGCFVKVFGADFMGLQAKPDAQAFQAVLRDIGADPSDCAMFEDSLKNLKTAKALGFATVLISGPTVEEEEATPADLRQAADVTVQKCDLPNLIAAWPQLWPCAIVNS